MFMQLVYKEKNVLSLNKPFTILLFDSLPFSGLICFKK